MTQNISWPVLSRADELIAQKHVTKQLRRALETLDAEILAVESPRIPEFEPWPEPYAGAEGFVEFEARRRRDFETLRREYDAVFAECHAVGQAMREAADRIFERCKQIGLSPRVDTGQGDAVSFDVRDVRHSPATSQSQLQRLSDLVVEGEACLREDDREKLEALAIEIMEFIKKPSGQIAPRSEQWPRPFVPWPTEEQQLQTKDKLDDIEARRHRQHQEAKREYEALGSLGYEGRIDRLALLGRVLGRLNPREKAPVIRDEIAADDKAALPQPEVPAEPPQELSASKRLAWTALPSGVQPLSAILEHFNRIAQSQPERAIDLERLRQIAGLGPDEIWLGRDEFTGYAVFVFRAAGVSVLDCPVYGNAVYLIEREQWEVLARRTKAELMRDHSAVVSRIVHSGDWLKRLEARVAPKTGPNL
jgi:hypothetical protein